jgi:hypothetical protein
MHKPPIMPLSGQQRVNPKGGGLCMKGGIYTEEKCSVCGGAMRDNGKNAVCCPSHPRQKASTYIVRFGRSIYKRSIDYKEASRFLTGLRFKTDEGSYDARDYKRANPLGFSNLADKYLAIKIQTVKPGTMRSLKPLMDRAKTHFDQMNVKEIGYGELEDFLLGLKGHGLSSKTIFNLRASLHNFFRWLVRRKELTKEQMPDFPEMTFEMSLRNIIDKDTQQAILDQIHADTFAKNPRIWLAIKWCATYIHVRPGELLQILEQDINLGLGTVSLKDHKTVRHTQSPKVIPLLSEDVEIIRTLPRGFPNMHFFRRDLGGGGRKAGTPFGKNLLYDTWKSACKKLGIEGVDLYGGTRHSSTQALRDFLTPDEIQELTGDTSDAFARYYRVQLGTMRAGFSLTRNWKDGKQVLKLEDRQKLEKELSPS